MVERGGGRCVCVWGGGEIERTIRRGVMGIGEKHGGGREGSGGQLRNRGEH